ncbi:alpha/beta hydrolase (plasmid) [Cupriavidus sp. KK10]|jgi:haloacetate dehalogenase|uniref:alpha/beta fold hydrolase n=1 Tax=Cupriavidus sp. KK10 TaxID=1478019 RepID=UPI001BA6AED9|nr:alpha/beta hydrolase [Cupriavidus sp. KK10]QUN32542.1 alpha/beta hydrolase [Cupriavidus sp. KK10]
MKTLEAGEAGHPDSRRRGFLISAAVSLAGVLSGQSSAALPSDSEPSAEPYFSGFRRLRIQAGGTTINTLVGGSGPPLLLLHGYPQTHIVWRKIAPDLARDHTVVLTDLRGYGDSGKPADGENHAGYSKRAMAVDQIEVMASLGFDHFAVVSHDRGSRVAHRMALDYPGRISRLVLMDIVPTEYMYRTTDARFATGYYHWFFLIQPAPLPESLLAGRVDAFLKSAMGPLIPHVIEHDAYAQYVRCFSDPATIHATCEDYRASASIDLDHDAADRGKKLACPLLVLWGGKGLVGTRYDVLSVWRDYATNVTGAALPANHWIPEEVPGQVVAHVRRFLA